MNAAVALDCAALHLARGLRPIKTAIAKYVCKQPICLWWFWHCSQVMCMRYERRSDARLRCAASRSRASPYQNRHSQMRLQAVDLPLVVLALLIANAYIISWIYFNLLKNFFDLLRFRLFLTEFFNIY